jgi:hypothetical protein
LVLARIVLFLLARKIVAAFYPVAAIMCAFMSGKSDQVSTCCVTVHSRSVVMFAAVLLVCGVVRWIGDVCFSACLDG